MKSSLLIGNGFALLVAAVELASRGHPVTLLTDGRPVGGHFAGLQLEGLDFDIGMVLLEERPAAEPGADLLSYNPSARNDWTRFGDRASAWIRSQVELVRAQTPDCLVEGCRMPDYMIANRLDGLARLDSVPSPQPLVRSHPHHAAHKFNAGAFDELSYAQAAASNHGTVWHNRFIEPFVRKVFDVSSEDFLARFHRAAWAPLYYPETLERSAAGKPSGLPEYPLWTTPTGFVGQLVRNLREVLIRFPHVSLVTQPLASISHHKGQWAIATANGQVHQSYRLAIGLTPDRAGALLGVPTAAPTPAAAVTLLFATVEASRIRAAHGCTMIVDEAYSAYRLTDHDTVAGLNPAQHRVVLEASPQSIARLHSGKRMELALQEELATLLGLDVQDPGNKAAIRLLRCFTAHNTLPIPTAEQVKHAGQSASALADAAPGAAMTGNLLGYGVASLNDQLIQGLKISEEFV